MGHQIAYVSPEPQSGALIPAASITIRAQVLLTLCSKPADCSLETSLRIVINDKKTLQVNPEQHRAAHTGLQRHMFLKGGTGQGLLCPSILLSEIPCHQGFEENMRPQQCFHHLHQVLCPPPPLPVQRQALPRKVHMASCWQTQHGSGSQSTAVQWNAQSCCKTPEQHIVPILPSEGPRSSPENALHIYMVITQSCSPDSI